MSQTLRELVLWAAAELQAYSESPRLDAEILLAHVLQRDRAYLLTWPEQELPASQINRFQALLQRRQEPQPVAYLVGFREFYSMRLKTTPATLVPRPETEMLVDEALQRISSGGSCDALEMGTGTGAIALAIKRHAPHCMVTATDNSPAALEVARHNGQALELDIEWLESDWFKALDLTRKFDLIVSNPPYIAEGDAYLQRGDLPAEPRQALVSGTHGLDAIEQIIAEAPGFLRPDGWLLLEHGHDQHQSVAALMQQHGLREINGKIDFNQLPRITLSRWPG
jgi:release factor glutamine methyltransferase